MMNRKETVNRISHATGIRAEKCIRIINSFGIVFTRKLEEARGVKAFSNRLFSGMDFLTKDAENHLDEETTRWIGEVARLSETRLDECRNVSQAFANLLSEQLHTSRIARIKFKAAFILVRFFRNHSINTSNR